MASSIAPFRHVVEDGCKLNHSDLEIYKTLKAAGCNVGRERVRTWIIEETAAGRLPQRNFSVRRGRKGKGAPPVEPAAIFSYHAVSGLERLLTSHAGSSVPVPLSLFPARGGLSDSHFQAGVERHGIPQTSEGEIDFALYAKNLGRDAVLSMTDLEFFLLAILQPSWRCNTGIASQEWVRSAVGEALEIRHVMIDAVNSLP